MFKAIKLNENKDTRDLPSSGSLSAPRHLTLSASILMDSSQIDGLGGLFYYRPAHSARAAIHSIRPTQIFSKLLLVRGQTTGLTATRHLQMQSEWSVHKRRKKPKY
jgi:hypothetical protein